MSAPNQSDIIVLNTPTDVAEEAARRFAAAARNSIQAGGRFSVALSGGSTPRAMYQVLRQAPLRDEIEWDKVHIFWGDERFVPTDDPESTYKMSHEELLSQVAIPQSNIHAVPTTGLGPEAAAEEYSKTIITFFQSNAPRIDLILLGMGPDGHTASLFPGHPEAAAPSNDLIVVVRNSPKPPPTRLSFTLRLINLASNVLFLVAGADKSSTILKVFTSPVDVSEIPVQGVRPERGSLIWLVDRNAAQLLES